MTDEELIVRLRNYGHVGTVLEAADRIEALVKENADFQQTFDFQWKADMRAIKMWQEAHPGNDLVWPDGAKLSVWLMERIESLVKERDDCAIYLKDGETPRQRMDRDHADVLSLMQLLSQEKSRAERLEAALTLAANRLQSRAVDYTPGSREFIETSEWEKDARALLAEIEGEKK